MADSLAFAAIALLASALAGCKGDEPVASPVAIAVGEKGPHAREIDHPANVAFDLREEPSTLQLVGALKNNTGRTSDFTVRCEATDEDGQIVGSGSDWIRDLPAGRSEAVLVYVTVTRPSVSWFCRVDPE